jgi:hypothetical protein
MKKAIVGLVILGVTVGSLLAQNNNVMVVDGKNGTLDDVIMDIILDKNIYNKKNISIQNVYYQFGTRTNTMPSFVELHPWFHNAYGFYKTSTMIDNVFNFFFYPADSDRDGQRLMLELNGKRYNVPRKVNIHGKFIVHTDSNYTSHLFLVESLEIEGNKYIGVLPETLLDPNRYRNKGKDLIRINW